MQITPGAFRSEPVPDIVEKVFFRRATRLLAGGWRHEKITNLELILCIAGSSRELCQCHGTRSGYMSFKRRLIYLVLEKVDERQDKNIGLVMGPPRNKSPERLSRSRRLGGFSPSGSVSATVD
jgi:hypothetical protein